MSTYQNVSPISKKKSRKNDLDNTTCINQPENSRSFFPSFERFLQMSIENYRHTQAPQILEAPKQQEKSFQTQISDFILPIFQEVKNPALIFQKEICEKQKKPVRIFNLKVPLDSTFDSEIESDNIQRVDLLKEVSRFALDISDQKNHLIFLRATEQLGIYQELGFELKEVLRTINGKLDEGKRVVYEYSCRYCGVGFKTGCGLGGHVSKVHVGLKLNPKKKRILKDFKHFDKERSRFFRKFKK